jgi:membrane protease YdiL (CAAX protease family)
MAVIAGVFFLRNAFAAVLFYHMVLLVCILKLNGASAFRKLTKGFHRYIGPVIVIGGIVPGLVIVYAWPLAKTAGIDLPNTLSSLNMGGPMLLLFALYACFVNPILEEAFWRGSFDKRSIWPNPIDALFAGYHAVAISPVVKPLFAVLLFAALVFTAWLFRQLYRLTGGLLIPFITHVIADIAILYAIWSISQ